MPRVITITIPDEWAEEGDVESVIEEFHVSLGRVCDNTDEWTDEERAG